MRIDIQPLDGQGKRAVHTITYGDYNAGRQHDAIGGETSSSCGCLVPVISVSRKP
jgi:hypothetical protein